jgi:hypothetical protein
MVALIIMEAASGSLVAGRSSGVHTGGKGYGFRDTGASTRCGRLKTTPVQPGIAGTKQGLVFFKSEIRISKSETNSNFQMFKVLSFGRFEIEYFEIVSDFVLRI